MKNPYPKDIFTPLSDEEMGICVQALLDTGIRNAADRYSANLMRKSWNNCLVSVIRAIEEEAETNPKSGLQPSSKERNHHDEKDNQHQL